MLPALNRRLPDTLASAGKVSVRVALRVMWLKLVTALPLTVEVPLKITVPPFASNVTGRVLLFIKAPCIVRLAEEGALNVPAVIRKLFATVKAVFNVTWGATDAVLFNSKVPNVLPEGENANVLATPAKLVVMFNVEDPSDEKTPAGYAV